MNINAFSKEGMEKVAELNGIQLEVDFFGKEGTDDDYLQQCFINLALRVHKKGTFKNIHMNFIEGMHRQMAWTHAIYGAQFHQDGLIIPNTLRVQDFEDAEFEVGFDHGFENNDEAFRNHIRRRFFCGNNDLFTKIPLSFYYVNATEVDATVLSDVFIHMSKLHSESKRDSNTRCPWQTLGVEAEKYVNSFTYDNIVFRPDFTGEKFCYRKIAYKDEHGVEDAVGNLGVVRSDEEESAPLASSIIESLYPNTSAVLSSNVFKAYIKNPYSSEAKQALIAYLSTGIVGGIYNITNEEEKDQIARNAGVDEGPKKIGYPFYPSYVSMTTDVGSDFKLNPRLNPMMANNIIHFPLVLTILWEAIKNLSRNDTLKDEARMQTIEYYLRFHNDPDENQTNLNLHGVYGQVYSLSQATNMYSSGAEIMGASHIICQMWNVFVAVQTESCLAKKEEHRKTAFNKAGAILKRTFTNIGNTVKSSNDMDVAVILGKFGIRKDCNITTFYLIEFLFFIIIPSKFGVHIMGDDWPTVC